MQDVADMERLAASCCSDCSPEVAREVLGLGLTALLECGTEVWRGDVRVGWGGGKGRGKGKPVRRIKGKAAGGGGVK